jgi:hypothetical protein
LLAEVSRGARRVLAQNEPNRCAGRPEIEVHAAGCQRKRHGVGLANAELAMNIPARRSARRLRQGCAAGELVKANFKANGVVA